MEPNLRDEDAEKMIEDFIRGPETDVSQWMNNSGQGDPELSRKDGHSIVFYLVSLIYIDHSSLY